MKRCFPILLLFFLLFLTPSARADGFSIYTDRSFAALHGEHTQIAAINYENGMEKLLLAVKLDQLEEDSVVWVVPVASEAKDVKINIFRDFPRFFGSDILMIAEEQGGYAYSFALAASWTQIYTMVIPLGYYGIFGPGILGMPGEGVEIYATVEKEGITTQVLKADTANDLYNYLNGKNIMISEGSLPILEEYIGEDYSFVVSWIRDIETEDTYRRPAIFIEFPTDKLYYPLKPTSIYGERGIPILLYVTGFAEPELFQEIEDYTYVRYFSGEIGEPYSEEGGGWLREFYSNATGDETTGRYSAQIYYTTIMIGTESEWLTPGMELKTPSADKLVQDLWIERLDSPPPEVAKALQTLERARFLRTGNTATVIIWVWIIIASVLAGWLAGLVMFKGFGKKPALLGLANCLTLFVFIIATFAAFKKNEVNRPKFILAFTIIFLIINFLVFAPLVTFFLF